VPIEADVAADDRAKLLLEVGHRAIIRYVVRRALAGVGAVLLLVGPVAAAPAAPGVRLKLLDSTKTLDSRELIGKAVLVLRFQASYCQPCVKESSAFGRLTERYHDRGVEMVAVHVQDTTSDVRKFVRAQRVTYPVALDPQLTVGNRFGFKGTPYTVVVDRKGEIVARLSGPSAVSRLPRILDRLTADKPRP